MRRFANEARLFYRGWLPLAGILAVLIFSVSGVFSLSGADPFSMRYMNPSATLTAMGAAKYAAIVCALAVALNALLYLSRDRRSRAEPILLSAADGRRLTLLRACVLLSYCALLCVLFAASVAATWLIAGLGFDGKALLLTALAVVLPAGVCALFLCAGIYLMTDSLDAGFLGFGALFFVSLFSQDYRLRWITTHVEWFSDFAGFDMHIPSILYARAIALLGFGALFVLGLLSMRHHSLGFLGSIRAQSARLPLLACAVLLCTACAEMALSEPFLDRHSPLMNRAELSAFGTEEDMGAAPADGDVRVLEVRSNVSIDAPRLFGTAAYRMEAADAPRRVVFLINGALEVSKARVGGADVPFFQSQGKVTLDVAAGERDVALTYEGKMQTPVMGSYPCLIGEKSVYLQEGSYWLPQPEDLAAGAIRMTGSVTLPSSLSIATPGKLTGKEESAGRTTWRYEAESHALDAALYAGAYDVTAIEASGVPVEIYHSGGHAAAVQGAGLAETIGDIVAFYTDMLGAYPFDAPMKVVETSLYKGGGHSSMNVVTAAETVFNMKMPKAGRENMLSFAYYNAVELLAHEIAHQWWGSGAQIATSAPWSGEGLAQVMATAYMEEAYSPDVANSLGLHAWASSVSELRGGYFSSEEKLGKLSESLRKQKEAELASSALYYEMPLILLDMRRQMGEEAFWAGMARVYQGRGEGAITYEAFCAEMGMKIEREALDIDGLVEDSWL